VVVVQKGFRLNMERAFAATGEEVLHFFQTDAQRGLSAEEVTAARAKYGKNGEIQTLPEYPSRLCQVH